MIQSYSSCLEIAIGPQAQVRPNGGTSTATNAQGPENLAADVNFEESDEDYNFEDDELL